MKFRKKPVVVVATQWWKNGDHPNDDIGEWALDEMKLLDKYPDAATEGVPKQARSDYDVRYQRIEGKVVRFYRHPEVDGYTWHGDLVNSGRPTCHIKMKEHGWIDTMEGGHTVCPGDWIITGVQGEMYPREPSIFAATYEGIEE